MPPKAVDYVQRLIRAEEERNRIIAEARSKKLQKVRAAKADAEKAVSDFRREKDNELAAYQQTLDTACNNDKLKATGDTEKAIEAMRRIANTRIDRVADILSDMICSVEVQTK